MTQAALPSFARRSRFAFAAAVLLALLVTVVEVPHATPVAAKASALIA
ncbi:hypothetical protein HZF05_00350 [Sphingomonas sp. CGMCC 1.13654]|uniref:Uncharacterized protein n=1 Tax=Sphingomonas chungangi TaxID=2683589 RepID=A0A838KZN2_9SPHN|nr:hypothetical protein [Sphingomonas chungangi]MBA2932531.1 hypothetical protein [Sphingomonas chungangi]MVW56154.1 hypothetical protein [Sphingomonas chungangi]